MITDEMIRHESGEPTRREQEWFAYLKEIADRCGLLNMDGDQGEDGYSLDQCLEWFEAGVSAEEAARRVDREVYGQ